MRLTPDQFRQELRRLVASPAWAELPAWFTEVMVRRVLKSNEPLAIAHKAAGDVAGAAALMLAIENAANQGVTHGDNATGREQRLARGAGEGAGGDGQATGGRQRSSRTGGQTAGEG